MLTAIITGVAGQDGSYLAEYLLSKNYTVIGVARRQSTNQTYKNLHAVTSNKNFVLKHGDINDSTFISRIVHDYKPHEFYNLAAQSHVQHSFVEPVFTFETDALAVIKQLQILKDYSPSTRYYQASTSELWGNSQCPKTGFNESSQFNPRSPYAVAKLAAFHAVKNYREAYGLFAVNGILTNHSSPRRGLDFATRKITKGCADIVKGKQKSIKMGNLSAFRDEGHSKEFMIAAHSILQSKEPKDYVVSTSKGATIEDMLKHVCSIASLDFDQVYEKDEKFMRPADVPYLLGDSSKIKEDIGWESTISWQELLKEMYLNDLLSE